VREAVRVSRFLFKVKVMSDIKKDLLMHISEEINSEISDMIEDSDSLIEDDNAFISAIGNLEVLFQVYEFCLVLIPPGNFENNQPKEILEEPKMVTSFCMGIISSIFDSIFSFSGFEDRQYAATIKIKNKEFEVYVFVSDGSLFDGVEEKTKRLMNE
jgi:hypothetical protein